MRISELEKQVEDLEHRMKTVLREIKFAGQKIGLNEDKDSQDARRIIRGI